jgi:hypothetical protein
MAGYYVARNARLRDHGAALRSGDPATLAMTYRRLACGLVLAAATASGGGSDQPTPPPVSVAASPPAASSAAPAAAPPPPDPAAAARAAAAAYAPPPVFQGVTAYINGRTGPLSAMHLARLIQLHGGEVSWTGGGGGGGGGGGAVTHVVCENLSGRKAEAALRPGPRARAVSRGRDRGVHGWGA